MGEHYEKTKDQAIQDLERELMFFRGENNRLKRKHQRLQDLAGKMQDRINELEAKLQEARERGGGVWP